MFGHGEEHVAHFAFVFRRHQDYVRHAAQISDVEQPVMRRAVAAGDASAIETELHIQILNTHVMD